VKNNKEADNDWFRLESNTEGTRWWGKAWTIQDMLRYEFDIEFDVTILMNEKSFFSYYSFAIRFLSHIR
jgi:hypothetical protein